MTRARQMILVAAVLALLGVGRALWLHRGGAGAGALDSQAMRQADVPSSPVASADRPPVRDTTEQDRVAPGYPEVELTEAQRDELSKLRGRYAELQVLIARSDREADLARVIAGGSPAVRTPMEALRAAVAARQEFIDRFAGHAEAGTKAAAAQDQLRVAKARVLRFADHAGSHLAGKTDEAVRAACDWCVRDADRIARKDSGLGPTYETEGQSLSEARSAAETSLREANATLRALARSAQESTEGMALARRIDEARQALDAALAAIPKYAGERQAAAAARREQQTISVRIAEVLSKGRLTTNTVTLAAGGAESGGKR